MPSKPLSKEEKDWKAKIDAIKDPALLSVICEAAESNPNYSSDESEDPDMEAEMQSMKKAKKPIFNTESEDMDENY